MHKICRQLRLNASYHAMDDSREFDCLGRYTENCTYADSAFSGTLWGISHD
jgi:hypothetical protein